jgi:predicted NBD/HSP70 family sugar kinase
LQACRAHSRSRPESTPSSVRYGEAPASWFDGPTVEERGVLSDRWVDLVHSLMADVPRRTRALLLFMAVCLVGGFFAGRDANTVVASGAAAALIVLAACAGVWFLVEMMRDHKAAPELPATAAFLTVRPLGGRYVIGVSIERGEVVFGALDLAGGASEALGNVRVHQLGPPRSRPWTRPLEAYAETARAIVQLLNESGDRKIDGIGIALPGLVDISQGELQSSPAGIAPGHVSSEIAKGMAEADFNAVRKLDFDIDVNALTRSLSKYVAIDNDSRCIGRYLLNCHPENRNFVSMYVGKGIGSAIVLDGGIYFGSHGFAGECGHQVLSLGLRVVLPQKDGTSRDVETAECGCRRKGAHYESLINDAGLLRLARALDPEFYAGLEANLTQTADFQGSSLLACASEVLVSEDSTEMVELCKRLAKGDHRRVLNFFQSLQDTYVQLLTMGIANLVNVLDLDNVYLCGPLVEGFDKIPGFRENMTYNIKQYLFREDRVNVRIEAAVAANVWIGAGLIFRDSGYADAVGPSTVESPPHLVDLRERAKSAADEHR